MNKLKSTDVLADPEIQRHTERILALQEEERQTRAKLGSIIAAIGAELLAVKEALDRTPAKTAWLRWLKQHVHYSVATAENCMRVGRFAKKIVSAYDFFNLDPTVLYRLAAWRRRSPQIHPRTAPARPPHVACPRISGLPPSRRALRRGTSSCCPPAVASSRRWVLTRPGAEPSMRLPIPTPTPMGTTRGLSEFQAAGSDLTIAGSVAGFPSVGTMPFPLSPFRSSAMVTPPRARRSGGPGRPRRRPA